MKGLSAHRNTSRVTYADIASIPTPPRTRTWGAIGHKDLVDLLHDAVLEADYGITKTEYSLSKDGGRMFGVMSLEAGKTRETARMIGFRNSIDKSMAVGITAGRVVFVCDNMAFSGEFLDYQKHVGRLTVEELRYSAQIAVGQVAAKIDAFEDWHEGLHNIQLSKQDVQTLTFRAVEQNVLSPGKFGQFYKLFIEKDNDQNEAVYDDSLYGFHGALTQIWNNNSLLGTGPRHTGLVQLIDVVKDEINVNGVINLN